MKKFFMKGTNKEIKFGDRIDLELVKETDEGVEHKSMSIKFTPLVVGLLKEEDVIEEKETKEEGLNFKDFCEQNKQKALEEVVKDLDERLTILEGVVAELTEE